MACLPSSEHIYFHPSSARPAQIWHRNGFLPFHLQKLVWARAGMAWEIHSSMPPRRRASQTRWYTAQSVLNAYYLTNSPKNTSPEQNTIWPAQHPEAHTSVIPLLFSSLTAYKVKLELSRQLHTITSLLNRCWSRRFLFHTNCFHIDCSPALVCWYF